MAIEVKLKVIYIFLLVTGLFFLVSPFFIPIFFAATVALTFRPLHRKLIHKGMRKNCAAALLTLIFSTIISIPLFFFLIKGTIAVTNKLEEISARDKPQGQGMREIVTDLRHGFIQVIEKYSSQYPFLNFLDKKKIVDYLVIANNYLLQFFKSFLASLPALIVFMLIMVLCIFSFLNHAEEIKLFFRRLFGFTEESMDELSLIFIKDSQQVYLSNILTGSVQSVIVATGVGLLHLGEFFIVFFVTLILSFIPVIGAAPVAFMFSLLGFLKGKTTAAVTLVVLGTFTGVIDNLMRPWLATFGESRIPPMVAFICVIGGAFLFGFPGLFLGLLVGSIAFDTLPIFWRELEIKK